MGTVINIVKGDKNFQLVFYIKDEEGNPISLVGVDYIVLKFRKYGDSDLFSLNGVVEDASAGKVSFDAGTTFVNLSGEYKGEIEIHYTNGQQLTAPDIVIKVIEDVG
jgi:hypothetical protein